jgi:hypothetical protein
MQARRKHACTHMYTRTTTHTRRHAHTHARTHTQIIELFVGADRDRDGGVLRAQHRAGVVRRAPADQVRPSAGGYSRVLPDSCLYGRACMCRSVCVCVCVCVGTKYKYEYRQLDYTNICVCECACGCRTAALTALWVTIYSAGWSLGAMERYSEYPEYPCALWTPKRAS